MNIKNRNKTTFTINEWNNREKGFEGKVSFET